jgi:hypothetical protein
MRSRGSAEAEPATAREAPSDPALDLMDVPAAVVCAVCGDADCPGCANQLETTHGSGVVAIVPWERPGLSFTERLWSTARLATTASNVFFTALPDGDLSSALRFALTCELLAVLGLGLVLAPLGFIFAPHLMHAVFSDPAARRDLVRVLVCSVPALAFSMILLHVLHGVGLDRGARRYGARPRRGRGLRFGLYSCGWDLVTLPLGLLVVLFSEGPRAAWQTAPLGMNVPAKAARAFLRGVYRLNDAQARAASRYAVALPAAAIVLGSIVALTLAVVFALIG